MADDVNFNCECEDTNPAETLLEYRKRMLIRLGYASIVNNPPPGMALLCDTFLRDAQTFMYMKYPAFRTRRWFRWQLEQGVRFYGLRDNNDATHSYDVTISIASPGHVIFGDNDAPANGRTLTLATTGALPTGLTAGTTYYVVGSTGNECQLSLTSGGAAINTSGSQSGVQTATVAPLASCIFNLEPYKDMQVWLVQPNEMWTPMGSGIPPYWYTTVSQQGVPARYDVRQCIEVFPAPNSNDYQLMVKGFFGLRPFTADGDKPTIDGDLVYLWALANAKAHYGQPDARDIATQAQTRIGQLVAGTHLQNRYIPGHIVLPPAIMPIFLPLNGAPP